MDTASTIARLEAERALLMAIIEQSPHPLDVYRPSDQARWIHNRRAAALDPRLDLPGVAPLASFQVTRADGNPYIPELNPVSRAFRGETVRGEEFYLSWNESARRYSTDAAPIYDVTGQLVAVVCTWDDVTALRQSEQEREELLKKMDESQRMFAGIAEATPDILFLYDLIEGRFVYHNNQITRLLGYTSDEELLEVVRTGAIGHPNDRERRRAARARLSALPHGDVMDLTHRLRHKNGTYRWFRGRSIVFTRDKDGRARLCLGLWQDVTERKDAEESLRISHDELEAIINGMSDGIVILGRDSKILRMNHAAAEIFGFPRDTGEFNGTVRRALEPRHPDGHPVATEEGASARALRGETVRDMELHIRNLRTGQPTIVNQAAMPIGAEDGSVAKVVVISTDITERKAIETERTRLIMALDGERALLSAIIDQSPQAISVFKPDGKRWMNNRRAVELNSPTGDIGAGDRDVLRLDGSRYRMEDLPIFRALRGETVVGEEFLLRHGSGLRRYVTSDVPVYDMHGRLVAAVATWDDITERRKTETERERLLTKIDESQRLFARIAAATPDLLFLLKLNERNFVYHNNQVTRLLGFTREEFAEVVLADRLLHPDDHELRNDIQPRVKELADGDVVEFEYRLLHKDGGYRWFAFRVAVFSRDTAGRPLIFLALAHDINERKLSEKAIREARDELELRVAERTAQLMHAEEAAQHHISRELHDEMGPHVTALKAGLETLKHADSDHQHVEKLIAVVQELDDQIDLLAHELRLSALDDFGIVAALTSYIDHFTKRFGLPVDFHHSGVSHNRLLPVIETTLYRVTQEALTNVLKHARARSASVILQRRENQVHLIIEDDGIGFDVSEMTERLGLVGMRERVTLAGGTLNVESTPGSLGTGTSIFVRLTI
jgi:PAS domain S-box-containing protein